jgi:hypothetical protein
MRLAGVLVCNQKERNMLTAILITLFVVGALAYALRSGRGDGALVRRPYNNRYNDASAARRDHLG